MGNPETPNFGNSKTISQDSTNVSIAPPAIEKINSPYFIREATLAQTLEKLKGVEKSKRKIIVYAGVHPNEGTDTLSEKYATEWAEKYGATVVCQPTEETPHAIWAKLKPATLEDPLPVLPPDLILDQEEYADKFSFDNKDTFVLMFHGTPAQYRDPVEERRGIRVDTSRYAKHPEDFIGRRYPIVFSKPAIMEGFENELSASRGGILNEIIEDKFQEDPARPGTDTKHPLWDPISPNTAIIEYYYKGQPVRIDDPYIKKLLEETEKGFDFLSKENWHRQGNIEPSYIDQPVLTKEDIRVFDEVIVKDFEKILAHLARQLAE